MLKHIGKQIRALRGEESQREFARRIGIPQTRLPAIEHGKANLTIKTLAQIAQRLDRRLCITFAEKCPPEGRDKRT